MSNLAQKQVTKIRVLPDTVINQIAAGEVVDRPASVVRELVDNAIDAGAERVDIYLESAGRALIKVCDDGFGMSHDDALLAFERHATSKLQTAKDLNEIGTLGFRGEALASIAAIARVHLSSRNAESPQSTEVYIEGGALKNVSSGSRSVGTEIAVKNIFFNTPARKKFLKSDRAEELRVKSWVLQSSLGHPEVFYRLFFDGKEVLSLPRKPSLKERAIGIFKGSMVAFGFDSRTPRNPTEVRLAGLIAHPSQAQADNSALSIVVNGRLISDRLIQKAVREGFDSTLKDREFPLGVLSIEMPASEVDVNVHPQKSEVRFRDSQAMFQLVRSTVLAAVHEFKAPLRGSFATTPYSTYSAPISQRAVLSSVPEYQVAQDRVGGNQVRQTPLLNLVSPQNQGPRTSLQDSPLAPQEPLATEASTEPHDDAFTFSQLNYVGQVLQCYLVGELRGALYLVDMHAAHERYNYNLVRNTYRNKKPQSQQLLVPITVALSPEGHEKCLAATALLVQLGFEIEDFGDTTVAVRAVPSMVKQSAVPALIKEVASCDYDAEGQGRFDELIDHIAARVACHASIRSGEMLRPEEVRALFASLDSTEFSAACPHGRPVVVKFSKNDVEKWFGRDR